MSITRAAWAQVTPMLVFSCFCLLVGDLLFGYDTGSFGGMLANEVSIDGPRYVTTRCADHRTTASLFQGFISQFGTYHPDTKKYAFDATHTSLISSLPFIGKFIGCFAAGPAIERFGHRTVFFGLSVVSIIGIISRSCPKRPSQTSNSFICHEKLSIHWTDGGLPQVEITAAGTALGSGRYAQFVVGRIVVYASIGLVEVDVT